MVARIVQVGEHYDIRASGDIDLDDAATLADYLTALAEQGPPHLAVDLTGVRYFGCSALNALLRGVTAAADHGGFLYVTGTSPQVQRVLDLTGTAKVVTNRQALPDDWPGTPIQGRA
jgi:anti-anti-sigma factor